MALPGGKRDPGEQPAATAVRETYEEVAIALDQPLGRLDDQFGRSTSKRVATFVFAVEGLPAPVPEPLEVQEAIWIPLQRLLDPASHGTYRWGGIVPAPALRIDERDDLGPHAPHRHALPRGRRARVTHDKEL